MDDVKSVSSVEQAIGLSVNLTNKANNQAARTALRQITINNLPGDPNDYHNAHTQAARLSDNKLALDIAQMGFGAYPDNADLTADYARALGTIGKTNEARELLESFHKKSPQEFARTWRPAVFYSSLVQKGKVDNDTMSTLRIILSDVTSRSPREPKVWSEWIQLEEKFGNIQEAQKIAKDALNSNPNSQQLWTVYGEMLLRTGDSANAVAALETAALRDYQDQYQHDVNQQAVLANIAQAYEAAGMYDKAKNMYISALSTNKKSQHIEDFSRNRLLMLEANNKIPKGTVNSLPVDGKDLMEVIARMKGLGE